jgi:hypothetical protein
MPVSNERHVKGSFFETMNGSDSNSPERWRRGLETKIIKQIQNADDIAFEAQY